MYASIKANKVVSTPLIENTDENEMREEFDFELYWIDEESSEEIFVPPFTSPGEMEEIVASKKREKEDAINEPSETNGNETIHDGYTDIMEKNSRNTRSEELDAMRQSRISNRSMESDAFGSSSDGKGENKKPSTETDFSRLEALYKSISTNKAVSTPKIIDDIDNDNNEIFDFELHLVDPETGEEIFHPPNTSPAEFDEMIADMKVQESKAVEDITNPVEPSNNIANKQLNTEPDETTFDGYTDIQKSNSRSTRSEELEAMRAARIANRGMESEAFGSS
jgi:PBP1b-binding outer membrane lipoprotein LpoB